MLNRELQAKLDTHGITICDETGLRELLEEHIETYTLYKLAPWPARRWKCRYRLMMRDQVYDAQSIEDVYAQALLAQLAGAKR